MVIMYLSHRYIAIKDRLRKYRCYIVIAILPSLAAKSHIARRRRLLYNYQLLLFRRYTYGLFLCLPPAKIFRLLFLPLSAPQADGVVVSIRQFEYDFRFTILILIRPDTIIINLVTSRRAMCHRTCKSRVASAALPAATHWLAAMILLKHRFDYFRANSTVAYGIKAFSFWVHELAMPAWCIWILGLRPH